MLQIQMYYMHMYTLLYIFTVKDRQYKPKVMWLSLHYQEFALHLYERQLRNNTMDALGDNFIKYMQASSLHMLALSLNIQKCSSDAENKHSQFSF